MDASLTNKKGIQWLPKAKTGMDVLIRILSVIGFILAVILVFAAVYLPFTYRWSQETWSDLTIEEIVYHLTMPMEGTGTGMIQQHIVKCVVPGAIAAIAFLVIMLLIRKKFRFTGYVKGLAAAISICVIANTFASFWKNMDVTQYVEHQSTYSSFMDENYVDPNSVTLTFPEKKRNLIYIFMESTECTFADESVGGAKKTNIIPELTQIGLENESFSDGKTINGGNVMKGATWTMGGMFAQTSGLPLNISIDGNSMSSQSEFFPGATVLGDILEEAGYTQTLLVGSEAAFGGRELYFTTHGNYQIRDYNYYIQNGTLPAGYRVWWGYEDKYLFENAKTELAQLSASGEPFNLTMLTVDTHFEDGYVCSECQNEFDDQYSNVYACASKMVSEFLEWLKTQPYYENTTVVISGDHLTMDKDFCNDVDSTYDRKVFTTIINSPTVKETDEKREYSTFDNFPTTLAALGVTIPGNRLALGTNLYSSEKTLYEIYGRGAFTDGLSSKSELMDNLTAGITTKMITLTPLDYNSELKLYQIIGSDIATAEEVSELVAYVWKENDKSDQMSYKATDRGDGKWMFNIPFSDFGFRSGTYNVSVYAKITDQIKCLLGATTISMSDPSMENSDQNIVETFSGMRVSEFDYATGTFEISYSEYDLSNIVGTDFAVWKEEDQRDIRWYVGQMGEDGAYHVTVDAMEFAFDDRPFKIHQFVTTIDGTNEFKQNESYQIQM